MAPSGGGYTPSAAGSGAQWQNSVSRQLEMISVRGRAVIVYSPVDTLALLKGIHDSYANAYDADSARRVSLNILSYALRH